MNQGACSVEHFSIREARHIVRDLFEPRPMIYWADFLTSIALGLDGPISRGLRWRAGAGLLRYWPTEERGIFLRGGTTRFLAGAGIDYRRPILAQWDMMASLRYDFHRFTTDELEARGFSQSQGVQRIAVTIGLARGRR